jgi:type IV secretory pathway VirJ component
MTPVPDFPGLARHAAALIAALGAIAVPPCRAQAVAPPPAAAAPSAMNHGLFTDVRVYRPAGDAQQFVMLVTDGVAPTPREARMLRAMLDDGAMVATVPFRPFYRNLAAQDGKCTYGPGAFENLSRHLQAFEHAPGYRPPLLVGADGASSYVYSVLAQAPAGTFAAGLVVGFSPRLALKTPPCATNALRVQAHAAARFVDLGPSSTALPAPWIALQDDSQGTRAAEAAQAFVGRVPQAGWIALGADRSPAAATAAFARAYRTLALPQAAVAAPPKPLADLPIVEVPVAAPGRRFVVLLSGDGGWAGIDKSLGAAFAAQGIPVAGFDSLRYFWSRRTPDELAADLDRIIRYYAARWERSDVLLVGYSQGADVLPFALNRLPAATRAAVRLAALLGPGQKASFEFHLTNWIGPSGDLPIAPEALRLPAASTLCIYGLDEKDSLCPQLSPAHAQALALAGGHHFGGDYGALAARILQAVPADAPR